MERSDFGGTEQSVIPFKWLDGFMEYISFDMNRLLKNEIQQKKDIGSCSVIGEILHYHTLTNSFLLNV